MQQTDPRKLAAVRLLTPLVVDAEQKQILPYLSSTEFQENVLPSLKNLEVLLLASWRRFSSPEVSPEPPLDLSDSAPIPQRPAITPLPASGADEGNDRERNLQMPSVGDLNLQGVHLQDASAGLAAENIGRTLTPNSPTAQQQLVTSAPPLPAEVRSTSKAPAATETGTRSPAARANAVEFTLPNASVGLPYAHVLLPASSVPSLVVKDVRFKDSIGLQFEASTGRLHGIPNKDGEFEVEIWFYTDTSKQDVASARLTVNPDPKSLWKNLPSDQNDPYWKPDEDSQFIEGSEGWSLVAGSKRGRSHAQKGSFRDDDFFICSQAGSGWQIAFVSDGAGSAKFSRRGSVIICKEGGQHLELALAGEAGTKLSSLVEAWQLSQQGAADLNAIRLIKTQLYVTLGYAAHFALTRIREECERRTDLGGVVKDYSSTILIGITKRFSFGVFCASFSIGDGAIGVARTHGTPELLCAPDGGEFSGQTRFLSQETVTQEELLKRLKFSLVPNFKGMYLMTDGISDPYFQTDKGLEMPDRWTKLLQDVEDEAALAKRDAGSGPRLVAWLDFWSKGEHDDRTLAVIF